MTWTDGGLDPTTAMLDEVSAAADSPAGESPEETGPGSCCPRIQWDLTLVPKSLDEAYWDSQAHKYSKWDSQVALFLLLMIGAMFMRQWNVSGVRAAAYTFAPAWSFTSGWLLAMQHPAFYTRHRVRLLTVIKLMLAFQTLHATNSIHDLLYLPGPLLIHGGPALYVLLTTVLVCNVAHFPCMCAALPLPLRVQLAWLCFTAFSLLLSTCPREMVTLTNTPVFLPVLASSNGLWARLVQSGQPPWVTPDAALQDRSYGMAAALLTIFTTCIAANMYLAYFMHWIELRAWLRTKARQAAAAVTTAVGGRAEPSVPPAAPADACVVRVGGVELTRAQLVSMERSLGASLLLDGRGLLGRTAMLLFHGAILNTLFLLAVGVSHLLALRLWPPLLPGSVLDMYYPLTPEVGGDVCRPGEEPRYEGWLGLLLWVMQR